MEIIERIPPRDPSTFDARTAEVAKLTKPGPDGLPFRHYATYAHNPWFLERWLRLAGTLVLRNSVSQRQKLLVIMRTAYALRCPFAWIERQSEKSSEWDIQELHARPQDVGVSDEELARIAAPLDPADWSEHDLAILQSVDETKELGGITSATWKKLASEFSQEQMFDHVALIGFYLLTMSTINSFGVQHYRDDDNAVPWDPVDNGSALLKR